MATLALSSNIDLPSVISPSSVFLPDDDIVDITFMFVNELDDDDDGTLCVRAACMFMVVWR